MGLSLAFSTTFSTVKGNPMGFLDKAVFKFDGISEFLVPQKFWCQICDENVVKSEFPSSGSFFQVAGHVRRFRARSMKSGEKVYKGHPDTLDETGEYENVIFAVCTECMGKN